MRSAPAVIYPVGRSSFFAVALLILGALGALTLMGWGYLASGVVWGWGLSGGFVLFALWVLLARRTWMQAPSGVLRWDPVESASEVSLRAGGWLWRHDSAREGVPVQGIGIVIDLQRWMLLRWGDSGVSWAWVEQQRSPERWQDLRRALVASATK
jgi:hypothetical protein